MNKFKIGDGVKVLRESKGYRGNANGGSSAYIVDNQNGENEWFLLEGDEGVMFAWLHEDDLKLTDSCLVPHIHKKEIIAWANGSKIQEWSYRSTCWISLTSPSWSVDCKYRVEPEVVKEEVFDMWEEEVERRVQKRLAQIKFQEEVEKGIDMLMHND